jgi:hypothetical protein
VKNMIGSVQVPTLFPGANILKYLLDHGGKDIAVANISGDLDYNPKEVMLHLKGLEGVGYVHFGWTPTEIRGKRGYKKDGKVSLDPEKMDLLLKLNKS